ncbi:MAG: hypothetical protein ACRERD_23095 [Candidatus Binatia bacterium]
MEFRIADTSLARLTSDAQKTVKTTALEQEIDRLVYKLYDLTPEEIKLVEENGQR